MNIDNIGLELSQKIFFKHFYHVFSSKMYFVEKSIQDFTNMIMKNEVKIIFYYKLNFSEIDYNLPYISNLINSKSFIKDVIQMRVLNVEFLTSYKYDEIKPSSKPVNHLSTFINFIGYMIRSLIFDLLLNILSSSSLSFNTKLMKF